MSYRYHQLAGQVIDRIRRGVYLPGDKLPGIRQFSNAARVSNATAVAAYRQLEADGFVEARPRSGYYVRPQSPLREPATTRPGVKPRAVTVQDLVMQMLQQISQPDVVPLGANIPHSSYLPLRQLGEATHAATNSARARAMQLQHPQGLPELRVSIARLMSEAGTPVDPEEIIVTAGCQEAIYLALKNSTRPGDVVAIESPAYYGLLQLIESLGLKALEIPTHPRDGISVDALQLALQEWPIKACVVVPNFSNPLGAVMPDNNRRQLIELLAANPDVTLIEDDIYGELGFDQKTHPSLKSLDKNNQVLYCSSFSKTVSPGLRVGWLVGGDRTAELAAEKFVTSCGTATLNQLVAHRFLQKGRYQRHIKEMRVKLQQGVGRMTERVASHFPSETRMACPQGGFALWLELPKEVDGTQLTNDALERGISIAPGRIFTTTRRYQNCIRLNCAVDWSRRVEDAIVTLAELVNNSMK